MGIKCFWLEPTDREKRYLRRYSSGSKCSGPMSYHDAMNFLDEGHEEIDPETRCWKDSGQTAADFKGHPLWPTHCTCGYEFQEADERQLFSSHIYRRADTGEEMTLREAPDGAMWDAFWYPEESKTRGNDGRVIICRVPNGHDWTIDGKATNCTRPDDFTHKCWIRHGEPPNLTVDKNGDTCGAGAGSVQTANWHGFLRGGELVNA